MAVLEPSLVAGSTGTITMEIIIGTYQSRRAARIQYEPREFQHTHLQCILGMGGKDKISEIWSS